MCKSSNLHSFLTELPKCEHHLHLEGCLTPALLFKLAAKNGITLPRDDPSYASPEALAKRYEHFDNLEDFLQCHYRAMAALLTQDDFEMLGWEYFTAAHRDGVRHAEVFFDPQSHTSRGVPFKTVVSGFRAACDRAEGELGITTRLIMCFLRHLPVSSAAETMRTAVELQCFRPSASSNGEPVISGLGLDSSEVGFHPELFAEIFLEAEKLGVHRTAHGGEEGDPTYISGALDGLHAERIDHGIRLIEDEALMRRAVTEGVLLTICPLSNVCLQVMQDVGQLPLREFIKSGVRFSLNSDDPAYFQGYILNNYCAVQDAFEFSISEWKTIAENSIHGSWFGKKRKSELMLEVDQCVEKYTNVS
ncbi:putative adenosine deaminase [Fusarium proliferatum ET1]|uniref:Adenine deaminase n=1 Tax=Fusarium proliferatum (strain ET1) TaxID=1227346 RepID=A0A1L7W1I0_FUSPR|nr:putative adenosine deaminase [Fusarium proliferatum ET1]CZR46176.1 probable adenosine deaminase [Fusarium proliferatum ET1]